MSRGRSDEPLGNKLKEIAGRNLAVDLEYIGTLPADPLVPRSIFERRATVAIHPESPYAGAISQVARRLAVGRKPDVPSLHEDDEDLVSQEDGPESGIPEIGGPSSPYEL